mmetsp:Transcript_4736/g.10429  ORF Transcript_4736/g.10429 Transcript_4736/m.10429 type:complete len:88 (-) Transcript_4736:41-304(-)
MRLERRCKRKRNQLQPALRASNTSTAQQGTVEAKMLVLIVAASTSWVESKAPCDIPIDNSWYGSNTNHHVCTEKVVDRSRRGSWPAF